MMEEENNSQPMPSQDQPAPAAGDPAVVPPPEPTTIDEPVVAAPPPPGKAPPPPVSAGIRLDKKHPLAIRWMHWINFPVLFTMIWSGILIYWNDSDNAYLHPHAIYRVGVGPVTMARLFPAW